MRENHLGAIASNAYRRHLGKLMLADTPEREYFSLREQERRAWALAADAIEAGIAVGITLVDGMAEMGYDCFNKHLYRWVFSYQARHEKERSAWNAVVLALADDFVRRQQPRVLRGNEP